MEVKWWNENAIIELAEHATADQFKEAAEAVASAIRSRTPVGTLRRPMYRTGPYAGQYWTARDAGELKRSVRVVDDTKGRTRAVRRGNRLVFLPANVRVYVGHSKAFYASIVEYSKPFVRPALAFVEQQVRQILGAR